MTNHFFGREWADQKLIESTSVLEDPRDLVQMLEVGDGLLSHYTDRIFAFFTSIEGTSITVNYRRKDRKVIYIRFDLGMRGPKYRHFRITFPSNPNHPATLEGDPLSLSRDESIDGLTPMLEEVKRRIKILMEA